MGLLINSSTGIPLTGSLLQPVKIDVIPPEPVHIGQAARHPFRFFGAQIKLKGFGARWVIGADEHSDLLAGIGIGIVGKANTCAALDPDVLGESIVMYEVTMFFHKCKKLM